MTKPVMFLSAMVVAFCCTNAQAETETVKAPKGGEIKATNDGYIEVVNARNAIKIYLYDKNLKAAKELKDISVIAEVQRATSKDHENLELKPSTGGFTAKFEPGETPKYYLDIGIANRKNGKADRVSFDMELPSESTTTALTP